MSISSWKFSEPKAHALLLGLILAILAGHTLRHGLDPLSLALGALIVLALYWRMRIHRGERRLLDQIGAMSRAIARGDLNFRITGIEPGHPLEEVAWDLNEGRDQEEAFFKEVRTCFQYAEQGLFHRRAMAAGLHGNYRDAIAKINTSLESLLQDERHRGETELKARLSELSARTLVSNLQLNQQDLSLITERMASVESISKQAADYAIAGVESMRNVSHTLQNLGGMMSDTRTAAQNLSERSREIFEVLSLITEIADQTNLLALNAAIEAARAGDHGRGFAVVADEVKKLAERTKQATGNVEEIIKGFSSATERMSGDAESMALETERSSEAVETFRETFSKIAENAQETHQTVSYAQVISNASLAKLDHIIFLQASHRAFETGPQSEEWRIATHDVNACDFGIWYEQGEGRRLFSHLPSFENLREPHDNVHRSISEALDLSQNDWRDDKACRENLIGAYERAGQASTELIQAIGTLNAEKERLEGRTSRETTDIELF